jgi:hypothetical protein
MVSFTIGRLSSLERVCLTVIACHGLTDFRSPLDLWTYAAAFLIPGWTVTPFFLMTSYWHFSHDLHWVGSAVFHAALGFLHVYGYSRTAFRILVAYMICLHVPLHYHRVWSEGTRPAMYSVVLALLFTVGAAVFEPIERAVLKDTAQRLVIAHVIFCEKLL